ncbi:MAG: 4Fe-4S binding protein [Desulfovibrio sp.]|jgi:MauM/NapG family ferredoxin protein|nr:4Fe-4S binding protein [Desulfovibrio sp.]
MRTARERGSRPVPGLISHVVRAISLLVFWFLLFAAVWPEPWRFAGSWPPVDFFLRMDPLAAVLAPLAARDWGAALWPGLVILGLSVAAGRFFCGWLCPFGTTLTLVRRLVRAKNPAPEKAYPAHTACSGTCPDDRPLDYKARNIKFFVLALMFGAAVAGVNDFYWGAPIPLITRFYALLFHPLLLLLSQLGLTLGRPLFTALDAPALLYLDLPARRFDGLYFLLAFFGLLFWLEGRYPRFWCRCLCPAGALLALVSRRPLFRRRARECRLCARCARHCPTGAIDPRTALAGQGECLTCLACSDVCPEGAISFTPWGKDDEHAAPSATADALHLPALPSRRAFLGGAGLGLLLAGVQYSGAHSLLNADARVVSPACIRPPGAVPEPAFLALCLRCGECMKVCPSNALQPAWLAAGQGGMFSPVLMPRHGPCVPECNACGQVCPTHAIQALSPEEKRWARVGTAVVLRRSCLAWSQGRACVVCQEVCPYGAVKLRGMEGLAAPAPVVDGSRCYGCGYCERHCPVAVPAIVVEPLNALRLKGASYQKTAREAGMDYTPVQRNEPTVDADLPVDGPPPGFTE